MRAPLPGLIRLALLPSLAVALAALPCAAAPKKNKSSAKSSAKAPPRAIKAQPATLDEKVQAKGALLVDVASGKILYQRNIDVPYAPASTTKLMTALLAYERTGLKGEITVAPADTQVEPSTIPLRAGETVQIDDMVHCLLIGSDNDSAMVLARASAGSVPDFVALMNERARQLGCRQTTFVNPHGLPDPRQKTTAVDLYRIFDRVLRVPQLREIAAQRNFVLHSDIGTQNVKNHNKLLGTYEGMGPAKTGWTMSSRHTYAASVVRGGRELRLIILNSPNKWDDARALFDYGFDRLNIPSPDASVAKAAKKGGRQSTLVSQNANSASSLPPPPKLTLP